MSDTDRKATLTAMGVTEGYQWERKRAEAFAERIAHALIDFGVSAAGELIRDFSLARTPAPGKGDDQ